jgi:peroxin-4
MFILRSAKPRSLLLSLPVPLSHHPQSGEICLDILKKEWSPAWNLQSACRAIISLLEEPAADSPLNCDAGNMIRANDTRAFNSVAKMYAIDYGIPV